MWKSLVGDDEEQGESLLGEDSGGLCSLSNTENLPICSLFDCWSCLHVTVNDCFCQTHQICIIIHLWKRISSGKVDSIGPRTSGCIRVNFFP
ncbi:uncharacterized protein LOC130936637 isoform X2 [Arachis stenosperma]|uniref:uncharacterized protein LOC130936637 isoform X2 n=1 Tax=Arachis stenosperma TaxID=217475 RepID=UPI0025ABCE28|nr:uncharacterized protein LOC130936637 isoform X2 [Arachis stenosperma]